MGKATRNHGNIATRRVPGRCRLILQCRASSEPQSWELFSELCTKQSRVIYSMPEVRSNCAV
jgi:hypothetical protein